MRYSVIVPVYNRPTEVEELLESLCAQTFTDFEVIVVEDGSSDKSDMICDKYKDRLDLKYYLEIIQQELDKEPCDAFGGPDRAHPSFTPIQKAINYSMTSFFTTGGIRGGKKKMDKFYPRSFNMGIRKDVFQKVGGFDNIRYGEDIDLSTRLFEAGYVCRLFPDAYVFHKRRVKFSSFFKQVKHSGEARVMLKRRYPDTFKLVHLLPAAFIVGHVVLILLAIFHRWWWILPIPVYIISIFIDSLIKNKSLKVALLSIPAAYCQLFGYGCGFIQNTFKH